MNQLKVVRASTIDGDFEGFDDNMLFKLADGTYWLQDEYNYWYHYAYCPSAEILSGQGRLFIRVDDRSEIVAVRQITDVTESAIKGEFKGWEGNTSYELVNGQVWRQSTYKYEYKYAHMPDVTVYESGGAHLMLVEGTTAEVRRIK